MLQEVVDCAKLTRVESTTAGLVQEVLKVSDVHICVFAFVMQEVFECFDEVRMVLRQNVSTLDIDT